MSLSTMIARRLSEHGLMLRGGFDFAEDETAPADPAGMVARAVLLVGHAGDTYWPQFRSWLDGRSEVPPDPLDTWSREVIGAVADEFGARAVSPSDRPYLPFQSWAMRAEGLKPSPLGILIHPRFGMWHAYRGALLFDRALALDPPQASNHPCDTCVGKACLNACPVEAVTSGGYKVDACRSHVVSVEGDCISAGCLARQACPVGTSYRYRLETQRFHMKAFVRP